MFYLIYQKIKTWTIYRENKMIKYCHFFHFNFKLGNGQTICKCGICSTVAYSTFKNSRTFFRLFFWPTHELKVINHSMLPRFTLSLVTTTWTPFVPMDGGKSPIFLFIFQDFSVIVIFQKMDILIIFL